MAAVTPSGSGAGSRPVNFRLPEWALEYLAARAAAGRTTKTQVVVEALTCLRERELDALMEEGYRDRAAEMLEISESALATAAETLPEW